MDNHPTEQSAELRSTTTTRDAPHQVAQDPPGKTTRLTHFVIAAMAITIVVGLLLRRTPEVPVTTANNTAVVTDTATRNENANVATQEDDSSEAARGDNNANEREKAERNVKPSEKPKAVTAGPNSVTPESVAKPEQEPDVPAPASAAALGPFNKKAAMLSLFPALKQAESCRRHSEPAGVAEAYVRFHPSGKLEYVRVFDTTYAGTATAACITEQLLNAKTPPYDGVARMLRIPVPVL